MNKEEEMHNYYLMFGEEITDIQDTFIDCFSEFISNLNDIDLSEETLKYLNALFKKDAKYFIKSIKKGE